MKNDSSQLMNIFYMDCRPKTIGALLFLLPVINNVVDVGSGGRAVERRTVNRGDGGSIPPTAISKLRQFLHPTFTCLSEETLKAFCLVSMPGEVKYPTQGVNV